MAHAKTQELIRYAERRVSENDRLLLNQHFEACAFCAREVRKFEEVLDALKGADLQRARSPVKLCCDAQTLTRTFGFQQTRRSSWDS